MSVVEEMIALFDAHQENIGCCDHDFPGEGVDDDNDKFVRQFNALICKHRGHVIAPDHCLKPEHDICGRCFKLATGIRERGEKIASDARGEP